MTFRYNYNLVYGRLQVHTVISGASLYAGCDCVTMTSRNVTWHRRPRCMPGRLSRHDFVMTGRCWCCGVERHRAITGSMGSYCRHCIDIGQSCMYRPICFAMRRTVGPAEYFDRQKERLDDTATVCRLPLD